MNFERLFFSGFLWVVLATALTFIFDDLIFMLISGVMFLQFIIVARSWAKHDIQQEDQNITDMMKKERLAREDSKK